MSEKEEEGFEEAQAMEGGKAAVVENEQYYEVKEGKLVLYRRCSLRGFDMDETTGIRCITDGLGPVKAYAGQVGWPVNSLFRPICWPAEPPVHQSTKDV